ncbi:efflux RND transporter periplasmic adaptor subunit [soil metagenome]
MQSETPVASPHAPKSLKIAGAVAAVIAVGVVVAGSVTRAEDNSAAKSWSDARAIPTVHLVPVTPSSASDALTLPGTMQAWNNARLFARVGGYLRGWYKDIGAEVDSGTVLGAIDTPELDQQIVQARAALASARANAGLARSTAERWNDLLSTSSVSKQEADEKNGDLLAKNAGVQGAEANLQRLLAQKAFATVRAPFAGVVTTRAADIGDLVGPGATSQQPLFSVADIRRIRIYVNVPQAYSASMTPGLQAKLTVPDYPDRTFVAQVIGNSAAINPQSGTFQVQLAVDNPGEALKPGGYAQVAFSVKGQAGTVQIPSSALLFRSQGTQVAMVDAGAHVRLQKVTVGRDLGGTVEITSGLKPSDKVIDSPPDSLTQGELIRIGGNARA